jgi:hypothetical protein
MECKPTDVTILSISGIENITKDNSKVDRKQTVIVREAGFPNKNAINKVTPTNTYQVDIWNTGIEKFKMAETFKVGDKVNIVFWINGLESNNHRGIQYKNTLALKKITKVP